MIETTRKGKSELIVKQEGKKLEVAYKGFSKDVVQLIDSQIRFDKYMNDMFTEDIFDENYGR